MTRLRCLLPNVPVIQTALNVPIGEIRELLPGQALLISKEGKLRTAQINKAREKKACSFERIYFSRGSDADIYKERKQLGEKLVPNILKAIDNDLDHTVFSFIPNTAEVAFYGMLQGLDNYLNEKKVRQIASPGNHPDHDELEVILSRRIRSEKVAIKVSNCALSLPRAIAGMTWQHTYMTSHTAVSVPVSTIW